MLVFDLQALEPLLPSVLLHHTPLRFSVVRGHPHGSDGIDSPAFLLVQVRKGVGHLKKKQLLSTKRATLADIAAGCSCFCGGVDGRDVLLSSNKYFTVQSTPYAF